MKKTLETLLSVTGTLFAGVLVAAHFNLDEKLKMAALPLKYKIKDISEETSKRVAADMMAK